MPFLEVGRGARLNLEPQSLNSETVIPGRVTLNHKPDTQVALSKAGGDRASVVGARQDHVAGRVFR